MIASDRSIDQVRADVLADLLLAGTPALDDTRDTTAGPLGAIRARVQVLIPAATLTGEDDGPSDLAGRSPIDPATARTLDEVEAHRKVARPMMSSVSNEQW